MSDKNKELLKNALPFLKEYYKGQMRWDSEWERKYQEWLDMLEEEGFELAEVMR